MRYYKVVSKKLCIAFWKWNEKRTYYTLDNIYGYKYKNGLRYSCQYIANELITEKELKKYYGITPDNIHEFPFLELVDIPKNKIHWFFGARFQDGTPIYYDENGNKIK